LPTNALAHLGGRGVALAEKRITNSKDVRKAPGHPPDPVAKAHFLSDEGDIDSGLLRIPRLRRARRLS
jgi:hypothetical protein